jgi:hypothetical protein
VTTPPPTGPVHFFVPSVDDSGPALALLAAARLMANEDGLITSERRVRRLRYRDHDDIVTAEVGGCVDDRADRLVVAIFEGPDFYVVKSDGGRLHGDRVAGDDVVSVDDFD